MMTFTEMNELKDMLIKSIAEVLNEKGINDFEIALERFYFENIHSHWRRGDYAKFHIVLKDKISNRHIHHIIFEDYKILRAMFEDIVIKHIKIIKEPKVVQASLNLYGEDVITLGNITKTTFKTAFNDYLDKNPYTKE